MRLMIMMIKILIIWSMGWKLFKYLFRVLFFSPHQIIRKPASYPPETATSHPFAINVDRIQRTSLWHCWRYGIADAVVQWTNSLSLLFLNKFAKYDNPEDVKTSYAGGREGEGLWKCPNSLKENQCSNKVQASGCLTVRLDKISRWYRTIFSKVMHTHWRTFDPRWNDGFVPARILIDSTCNMIVLCQSVTKLQGERDKYHEIARESKYRRRSNIRDDNKSIPSIQSQNIGQQTHNFESHDWCHLWHVDCNPSIFQCDGDVILQNGTRVRAHLDRTHFLSFPIDGFLSAEDNRKYLQSIFSRMPSDTQMSICVSPATRIQTVVQKVPIAYVIRFARCRRAICVPAFRSIWQKFSHVCN